MPKLFQRKIEDFTCRNCGHFVVGTGYTNHCPKCLYSEHVDINPGDRANPCKGLMEPIGLIKKRGEFFIVHKCLKCGEIRHNKTSGGDNPQKILELSTLPFSTA